jgi:hypothetical protein
LPRRCAEDERYPTNHQENGTIVIFFHRKLPQLHSVRVPNLSSP